MAKHLSEPAGVSEDSLGSLQSVGGTRDRDRQYLLSGGASQREPLKNSTPSMASRIPSPPARTRRNPSAGRCDAGPGWKKSARTPLGNEAERPRNRAIPLDFPSAPLVLCPAVGRIWTRPPGPLMSRVSRPPTGPFQVPTVGIVRRHGALDGIQEADDLKCSLCARAGL